VPEAVIIGLLDRDAARDCVGYTEGSRNPRFNG
jgi:hypothetical protein